MKLQDLNEDQIKFEFGQEPNVKIIDRGEEYLGWNFKLGNLNGEPITIKVHNDSYELYVGYWDKEHEEFSIDPEQSYMVLFTEYHGAIHLVPVNDEEHMEKLLNKITIL